MDIHLPQKAKIYRDADEQIKKVITEIKSFDAIEFLKGVVHNYEFLRLSSFINF